MKNRKLTVIASVVLIMATLLSLTGCGCSRKVEEPTVAPTQAPTQAPTEEPTEEPTEAPTEEPTEPAPTEPESEPGLAKANYVEALYSLMNKGDEVEVVGKFAHYYVVAGEPYDLLVDSRFVRLATDASFKSWTAYARHKRPVFDSVYMDKEPIAYLKTNTKLTVLEAKDNWVYVEWKDGKGYMKEDDISKGRISTGGGGSSSSDGTDVDVGSLSATGIQGGITMLGAYHGPEMEAGFEKTTGVILADEVEAYIGVFGFSDEMKVVSYDDEFCTIYLGTDLTARVRRDLVKLEGDAEEEPFTGYSRANAVVFKEYQQRTEYKKLKTNNKVEVLYKLPGTGYGDEGIYVVSVDGEIMYMQVATVSEKKLKTYSGGSSSGDVWTPPAL